MIRIILIVLIGIVLRILIGYSNYSGESDPPRFGDFEAQRHWMEITVNLPIDKWYVDNKHNNLEYWPLDYPPLTAYHSMICGYIARYLGLGDSLILDSSRGFESYSFKWFMRGTVLISDLLIFFTSLVFYWHISNVSERKSDSSKYLLVSLIASPYIFVDHSHFQYNCVALGLMIWSVNFLYCGYYLLSIVLIISSIFFKQTMLYFLPSFTFMFISIIFHTKGNINKIKRLVYYCLSAVFTVLIILLPFIFNEIFHPEYYVNIVPTNKLEVFLSKFNFRFLIPIIRRVIPVWRGAWENHVASFWFANVFIFNLKKWAMISEINLNIALQICTTTTLLGFTPSCLNLIKNPTRKNFELSLVSSSLSFFLFSWQVHEKSILLPLTPGLLLMDIYPWLSLNLIIISSFSLVTLSILDRSVPFLVIFSLFSIIISFQFLYKDAQGYSGITGRLLNKVSILISFLFSIMLVFQNQIPPPKRYPWLHEYLNAFVCAWILLSILIVCTAESLSFIKFNSFKKCANSKKTKNMTVIRF